ncbi:MAG: choice-of-anchor J domain-containing protein [Flavobacteriaceae bacterium]|nr:choice-of-anchor J domain-containing protein [Flavobacteriaceae bacterium]
MKKIKFLTLGIIVSLTSCVTGDDYGTPDLSNECVTMNATVAIENLNSSATAIPQQYNSTTDSIIEAYVTSSDEGGNFYKSISMVAYDAAGDEYGFSVPVDQYNLFNEFEPGRKVYINMNKLYYATKYDGLLIGNYFNNSIGRLLPFEYKNIISRSCEKKNEDELVHSFNQINQAATDEYINKLIEFEDVQFVSSAVGGTYYDANNDVGGATNLMIEDKFGNQVMVRTSSYAKFKDDIIPSGNGKIRCVLTKYISYSGAVSYQFMLRTINDVQLTNERYVPTVLFQESFETTTFPNWTAYSVIGAQVWGTTTFGNPAPCAIMNGYSSGNQNNEDWLISPAIDLSSNTFAILTFDTSTRFTGPALEAYISTDYDGTSAPSTATWTQLTGFNLPVYTSGSYTSWSAGASGGINISSYTGNSNVRVAFKYTSTTAAAAAWELDNVKVLGQ